MPTINRLKMKDLQKDTIVEEMKDATIQTEDTKPHPKRRPKRYTPTSKTKILESETWYLRLGGCNETTMDELTKHAIGLPEFFEWHSFRFIDFREQARIQKKPVGRNPTKVAERGQQFYFDFGFIRVSNEDYSRPTKNKDHVVKSYEGYSSYLLVVDEVSKYSWIFLTKSKDPPIELTKLFLQEYAHVDEGKIRCDQGGELARSSEWRKMVLKEFKYYVERTGADSPSQNGQVEKYNNTLSTIVRTLLYGSNLPAKYWSAAALHAVYLMNQRIHSAIGMTPYEAWWDEQPDLSLLKVFGSRVCVKVTGKRRAKLDRHDFNGIFIRYTATDDNIKYIDIDTGVTKVSHHAVFDKAWYLQPARPPMAQLLYDMGMEADTEEITPATLPPTPNLAKYPPMPTTDMKLPAITKATNKPIPLRLSEAPPKLEYNARAAKAETRTREFGIIEDMQLDKEDTFAQIYLSPSPYFEAFEEELDIRKWSSTNDHRTAGLSIIKNQDRLVLANILRSTPAARIDKWRTRCRGALIVEVNGIPVNEIEDVATVLHQCKEKGYKSVRILMAHRRNQSRSNIQRHSTNPH
jgi:hypothetical protein